MCYCISLRLVANEIEYANNVVQMWFSFDCRVVPTVVTTVIYTAPPDATVTATIGVQQFATEQVSIVESVTQTLPGIVTHTIAPTGIAS
jgi:hypothetical protein